MSLDRPRRLVAGGALAALVLTAVLLAAVELLFLPLRVAGVPLPVTILLAALTTPWLVHSAAALGGHPALAAVPLVAWVAAILVFGVAGPGGDVLLPAEWRSLVLLGAGIFPSSIQLGRALASG